MEKPVSYTLTWEVTDEMTAKRIGSAGARILAPTPVGMKVSATATLRSIERRKMWFDIEVRDEKGKCGEGSHLRIMVPDRDRSKPEG